MEQLEQDELTIDLRELLQILRKRLSLIVTITLIATLTSAILSFFVLTPIYEATTEILVDRTDSAIIKSPRIINLVIEKYNLNLTPQELTEKIDVTAAKDSKVISIKVTDSSQAEAVKIANAIAETFKEITKITKAGNVQILSQAKVQDDPIPVKPKPFLNIAIAFVVGLMTSIGVVFLLEYLDTSVKTEEQLEQLLGLPVLGSIATIEETKRTKRESTSVMARGRSYEA
ncbi:YveK family protein [Tepidibacillus sp. LV47]|uniref:YveK family protein n=1 Tax=Tepidibacillus sp. LV47 TaxID=3398228 RepID=UPI003AAFA47D